MFTLSNPLLLWAMPVLLLPWIFRRRPEERVQHLNFPLIQFLRESEEKDLINPQLQELLLLILRTVLLAVLILALAGPEWVSDGQPGRGWFSFLPFGGRFENHTVVIDSSYSMGYGQGERSWWQKAKQVRDQAGRGLSGLAVTYVRWDRSTLPLNRAARLVPLSAAELNQLFETSPNQPGASITELAEALKRSVALEGSILLITDGQRVPWLPLLQATARPDAFPPLVAVTVGEGPLVNTWCDIQTHSSPPWGIAGWETLAGQVHSLRDEAGGEGTVSIQLKDRAEQLFSRALTFPGATPDPVAIPFSFTARFLDLIPGNNPVPPVLEFVVQVSPGDPLPVDNQVVVRVPTAPAFRVGFAQGVEEDNPVLPVLYSALNPPADEGKPSPVTLTRVALPFMIDESQVDLVLLEKSLVGDRLDAADSSALMEYVKNGGAVILFTGGEPSAPGPWTALLETMGWRWLEATPAGDQPSPVSVNSTGIWGKALSTWEPSMWQPWMPARAGRLETGEIHPRVVYQAGSQTAHLISEAVVGKGRVWVVNTGLRPEAGVWLSPLLPVFLWETAKDTARLRRPVSFQLSESNAESDIRLLSNEEKQQLSQTYGVRFIPPEEMGELAASLYGGTDLRALLLAFGGALALLESWLANRLASL
ncbi:MAG: BatA domain-containing protein [bacterium]